MAEDKRNFNGRNYGIDFLRIISMFMIVVIHVLNQGGILDSTTNLSVNKEVSWYIFIAVYCATNIYGLISGYVNYGKKQKLSSVFYLLFHVLFYTILTTLVFFIYKPETVDLKIIVKAIFPFAYDVYWYYTAYFSLYFLMPILNRIAETLDRNTFIKMILTLMFVFSVVPTIFYYDTGKTQNGYSVWWLAILYFIGAYLKKYKSERKKRTVKTNVVIYLCMVSITWLSRLIIELLTVGVLGLEKPIAENYLVTYTSPTIIICALAMVLIFEEVQCNGLLKKFINFFAPVSFGVYLFHEEPLIVTYILRGAFKMYASLNPFAMSILAIGTSLMIWLIGSVIDKIRMKFFEFIKIRSLCALLENKIAAFVKYLEKRVIR